MTDSKKQKTTPAAPAAKPKGGLAAQVRAALTSNVTEHRESTQSSSHPDESNRVARQILVDLIDPNPNQPRIDFPEEYIESLASSIDENELRNPIEVRPIGARFELVQGECRLRAHKKLQKRFITAFVIHVSDEESAKIAFIENYHRKDLSDFETFLSLNKIKKTFSNWRTMTEELKVSKSTYFRIQSFDVLSEPIIDLLRVKPKLITGLAAEKIKQAIDAIEKEGVEREAINKALRQAIQATIDGTVITKDFAAFLKQKFAATPKIGDKPVPIMRGQDQFALISKTKKAITVKINTKDLTDDKVAKLEAFITKLASE